MNTTRFGQILSIVAALAVPLSGCSITEGRRDGGHALGGAADDGLESTAIMSAWIRPDGYDDAQLIALAEEYGGYDSIVNAAVAKGYINNGGQDAADGGTQGDGGGGTWGDGGDGTQGGGDGGTWGDGGGDGGTWGDGGGDGGTWGDGGGDGGTWGDGGGDGGTWGGDGGGGDGGTWGGDGGGGDTWGDGGGDGGYGSSGLGDAPDPGGTQFREAAVVSRMTGYAVTAGIVSQLDTPAPGPADLIALGILAFGMYMAKGGKAMNCVCKFNGDWSLNADSGGPCPPRVWGTGVGRQKCFSNARAQAPAGCISGNNYYRHCQQTN